MSSVQPTHFPFRSLPSEIRNKIYRELLFIFDSSPPAANYYGAFEASLTSATHRIDTAILRTNSTTYREAYDVLVKTNRFVRITSVRGAPLSRIMGNLTVSVVTWNGIAVEAFKGYVLAVILGCLDPKETSAEALENGLPVTHQDMMILYRDLDVFCRALTQVDAFQPGLSVTLQLLISMAPILSNPVATGYAISFTDFFSGKTQRTLLAPFRKHLRGYTSVQVTGHVDADIALETCEELQQDRYSDPKAVVADLWSTFTEGMDLVEGGNIDAACKVWQDASIDVQRIIGSTAWSKLVALGGKSFCARIVEFYVA